MQVAARQIDLPQLGTAPTRGAWTAPAVDSSPHGLSLATITRLGDLDRLETEWTALFDAAGCPQQVFQTFGWLKTWAALYVDGRTRLSIVTGRIDGRLVLVWPLVVQTHLGLRVLTFMGEPLSQYGDALMAPDIGDAAADAAFDYVMALPVDVVSLRRVRDDSALAPLLARRLGAAINRQAAPVMPLAGTPDVAAFEKRFPGKLRASRRRRRRRLEERGAVSFTHYKPSPNAAAFVATALDFKREWARQSGVLSPSLRDPRFERFFTDAALPGRVDSGLRVSVLRCGSEILGIEMSVVCKNRLFGHVLAPRPGLAQLGLGGILAESVILNALDQGYEAVDLLAPADPYKLEWTQDVVGVGDYIATRNVCGDIYARVWLRYGRDLLKTAMTRLEPHIAAWSRRFSR